MSLKIKIACTSQQRHIGSRCIVQILTWKASRQEMRDVPLLENDGPFASGIVHEGMTKLENRGVNQMWLPEPVCHKCQSRAAMRVLHRGI